MNYGLKLINPINDGKDYYVKGFEGYGVDRINLRIVLQEEFFALSTDISFLDTLIPLIDYGLEYAIMYNMSEEDYEDERVTFLQQQILFLQEAEAYRQAQLDALTGGGGGG